MKNKIIIALTACLFAAGSIINMHLAQNDHNSDISLAVISEMAKAGGEEPTILCGTYCPYPGPGCQVRDPNTGEWQYCPDKGSIGG